MPLTFLTPMMLAGAALIAAPIILHLVMRQQPKHFIFPALRFLQQRNDVNQRKLKLRHLLLLLLRCAAILLFALALARPSLKSAGFLGDREAPVAAALVFDTSPRMEYQHQNQTRLKVAQSAAERVLAQLPPESEIAVLDSRTAAAAFSIDGAVARQRVDRLRMTPSLQSLSELCHEALRLVKESDKGRKEVYLFTDLSRVAWSPEAGAKLHDQLEANKEIALYIIDVGVEDPRDFALGDLRLPAELLAKHTPLRVETDLIRVGPEEERTVELSLMDSAGKSHVRGQSIVKSTPDSPQFVDFSVAGFEQGTHQGVVRISSQDNLPADDARYFTIDVRPPWRVLIAATPANRHKAANMAQAIAPESIQRTGQARFECEMVSINELAGKPLEEYAAVCLVDPPPLSDSVWQSLTEFVERGGGLMMFLGPSAAPPGQRPEDFSAPAAHQLLPGKLARRWNHQDSFLAPQDYQHPLLSKFRAIAGSIPWDAYTIETHWQFTDLDQGVNTIIPYSNGQAALLEKPLGKGRILVFTTDVNDNAEDKDLWNLLVVGSQPWPFFMLRNEAMLYLVGSGEERLNYLVGDTVTMRIPEPQRQLFFSLETPDGENLPQSVDQKTGTLTITTSNAPGNYVLRAGASDGGVLYGFSVNIPAASTELARITNDELAELLGKGRFRLSRGKEDIERDVNLGRTGIELYPLLIVLVAIVLGGEHLLANKFYKRDDPGLNPPRRSFALESDKVNAQEVDRTQKAELELQNAH
ncbi:MAG: BatA domain-containing protein [Pirellulales bacterium]|nr:BatA domain-containing protein [Pirellulales bacterium]